MWQHSAPSRPTLIGVDFLSHFGLLVDCKHNRLLDGVTSLSVQAQAASSLIPSVKTISGGTPVDSLLAGVQREVGHNTVHHIRTPVDHGDYHRTGSSV
jgi:hypothetical protein